MTRPWTTAHPSAFNDQIATSPKLYAQWLNGQLSEKFTFKELARRAAQVASGAAQFRSARLYERAGLQDNMLERAGQAVLLGDEVVRAHVLALLARHDVTLALDCQGELALTRGVSPVPALNRALQVLRDGAQRTAFTLEGEIALLLAISEQAVTRHDYVQARAAAGEALLLSFPLDLPGLTLYARLSVALCALRDGDVPAALEEYTSVSTDQAAGEQQRINARLNLALVQLRLGRDQIAGEVLAALRSKRPDDPAVRVSDQFALALRGQLPRLEPITQCPSGNYTCLTQALQRAAPHTLPETRVVVETLELLRGCRPNSSSLDDYVGWLHGLCLLRLQQPLAALRRSEGITTRMPDQRLMISALRLDVALQYDGVDAAPLPELCDNVKTHFLALPDRDARRGLAARVATWHPLATAFVAYAPGGLPDLLDTAGPAVLRNGRPISVQHRTVSSKVLFVQMTLAAFGIEAHIPRDLHVEKRRLLQALNDPADAGAQKPVVLPALLAYQLVRAGQHGGPAWRQAARELARAHGLVPPTHGDHLREQRHRLQQALKGLLNDAMTDGEFRAVVAEIRREA